MEISLDLVGERSVSLRFEKFPEFARVNLKQAITEQTAKLEEAVRRGAPKKTGKLEASINSRISDGENGITGIVAVDGDYGKAGALEYGSQREINFKLTHLFEYILTPPLKIQRQLNLTPHRFLRGPEEAMAGEALEAMRAALDKAVEQANEL
jgi:hypothetical protein